MKRKQIIWALSLIVAASLLWSVWPYLVVARFSMVDRQDEEGSQRVCNEIVACGPRAIPAAIRSIEINSPWVRRYCYLPIALGRLGPPAHDTLLVAVDEESDPRKRAYLISSLVTAFDDFSRFHLWLEDVDAKRVSKWSMVHFASAVRQHLPDAPELLKGEGLNPEFLAWWRLKTP